MASAGTHTLDAPLRPGDWSQQGLRVYFTRYRFADPTGADFRRTMEEVSGRKDLEPYFAQAIDGTEMLDYSVESLSSGPVNGGTAKRQAAALKPVSWCGAEAPSSSR